MSTTHPHTLEAHGGLGLARNTHTHTHYTHYTHTTHTLHTHTGTHTHTTHTHWHRGAAPQTRRECTLAPLQAWIGLRSAAAPTARAAVSAVVVFESRARWLTRSRSMRAERTSTILVSTHMTARSRSHALTRPHARAHTHAHACMHTGRHARAHTRALAQSKVKRTGSRTLTRCAHT